MKSLSVLLVLAILMLTSCATTTIPPSARQKNSLEEVRRLSDARGWDTKAIAAAYRADAETLPTLPSTSTADVVGGLIGAAILVPLLVPIAAVANMEVIVTSPAAATPIKTILTPSAISIVLWRAMAAR